MIIIVGHIPDEIGMLIDLARDQGHIIGTGVVIAVMQPVEGDEICVFTAQLPGPLIHEVRKVLLRPGHLFSQGYGDFIGRSDQKAVQGLFDGDGLSDIHAYVGAAALDPVDSVFRESDMVCQVEVFISQQRSHEFCDTGRVEVFVNVLAIQDLPAVRVHDDSSGGSYPRSLRPACSAVGLDGF